MPLASLSGSLTSLIGDHGLYAVFALMAIDAVLPAASELVMVYGGALAAGAFASQNVVLFGERIEAGAPAYTAIALAGTIGYVLGSIAGWALGVYGGRPFLERRGRWLHLGPERLDRAERWFDRWDSLAVFLGRILPVVRSFISIPAGVFRMPLGPYTLLTSVGSALWCFALAGVGWALGHNWERFHHAFRYADYAVAAVVGALAIYLLARARSRRLHRSTDA
ncbi:MAG: DedA family protein [Actinomycetota bacterium]|nr:DedA family protein [Actinomycetota bacterium]